MSTVLRITRGNAQHIMDLGNHLNDTIGDAERQSVITTPFTNHELLETSMGRSDALRPTIMLTSNYHQNSLVTPRAMASSLRLPSTVKFVIPRRNTTVGSAETALIIPLSVTVNGDQHANAFSCNTKLHVLFFAGINVDSACG